MKKKRTFNNKKSQPSFIEKFGIITSFVFSLIAFIVSIINYKVERTERIIILDGYESNYIFDGENLYRNICFAIANNSDNNISITEISIKLDGENYLFESVGNSVCPINMNSNETVKKTIEIPLEIDEDDKEFILNKYGENFNIDAYELETYFATGEDIQNLHNVVVSPEIEIKVKTAKGKETKFYKTKYYDYTGYDETYILDMLSEGVGK